MSSARGYRANAASVTLIRENTPADDAVATASNTAESSAIPSPAHPGVCGWSKPPRGECHEIREIDQRAFEIGLGRQRRCRRIPEACGNGCGDHCALTARQRYVPVECVALPGGRQIDGARPAGQLDGPRRVRIRRRSGPQVRRRGRFDVRGAKGVRVVEIHADGVGDAVEVAEERGLQHRVQDSGVVEPRGAGAVELGASHRPGLLRHGNGKADKGPDGRVGMPIRNGARIDDYRARERVIVNGGTQKLCVSRRSIEALIEARRRRRH